VADADLAGERVQAGVTVQQLALCAARGSGPKLVLAMNIDEDAAGLRSSHVTPARSGRHATPVADHAHLQLAVDAHRPLLEPLLSSRRARLRSRVPATSARSAP
jgi:hypothetical protein